MGASPMCEITQFQVTYASVELAAVDGYTVPITEHLKMRQKANCAMIAAAIKDLGTIPNCVIFDVEHRTLAVYRKPPVKFV